MTDKKYPYLPDKVDIYISYTQRKDKDKKIAQAFYDACYAHPRIEPHIDEKDIPYQANIYEYMDRLSSAPFIVCIFSEGYFQSENCVMEFVDCCHHDYLEFRLIPLFREFFFNETDRQQWMLFNQDDPVLQESVKEKTGRNLADLLESGRKKVMKKLAGNNDETAEWHKENDFEKFLTTFLEIANKRNKQQFEDLRYELVKNVQKRLTDRAFKDFLITLAEKMDCSETAESCAEKLFSQNVLSSMEVLVDCRKLCSFKTPLDRKFKEVFGFLLVSTIRPDWWLMNEFHLRYSLKNGYGVKADGLSNKCEIELVFARVGKRPAMFRAKESRIVPENFLQQGEHIAFTNDSKSLFASYLRSFYEDLTKESLEGAAILDEAELLGTLEGRFRGLKRRKRQYFYIIPEREYENIKQLGVLHAINTLSKQAVQFVVVGSAKRNDPDVLTVRSSDILGYLSEIHHG